MFKVLKNSRNVTKLALLAILLNIGIYSITSGNSVVIAEWGDVVDVKYSLWEDSGHTIEVSGNINITLPYIYLSNEATVPQEIKALFPEATAAILLKFKEAIIGLSVNETFDFKINSTDAYGTGDQYYRITVLIIRYDSSNENTSITATLPSSESTHSSTIESDTTKSTETTTNDTIQSTTNEATIPELTSGSSIIISMIFLFSIVLLRRQKRQV